MQKAKVWVLFKRYRDVLHEFRSLRFEDSRVVAINDAANFTAIYQHIKWMCEQGMQFVDERRMEKAMRWLGFVQATWWLLGHQSISDLKSTNMPRRLGSE